MAQVIDCKALAAEITAQVRRSVSELKNQSACVKLVCVMVGENEAGELYSRSQAGRCKDLGIDYQLETIPGGTSLSKVAEVIAGLNQDRGVTGIMLSLPLPDGMDPTEVQYAIDPYKDVEGVNPSNIGFVFYGRPIIAPCAALSVVEILSRTGQPIKGKDIVIVGQGAIVGRPMTLLMLQEEATVTACHKETRDLKQHTRQADVLIVAVGKPGLICGDMIKPGAVVIDAGINRIRDARGTTRTVGDVDFQSVSPVASFITPVPGGVGPVTVAILLRNTVESARKQFHHSPRLGDRPNHRSRSPNRKKTERTEN